MSTTPRINVVDYDGGTYDARHFLGHHPELLAAFDDLYTAMWSGGTVGHPTKEVCRLRNARMTDCGVCRQVRFSVARDQGLTEDLVELIADDFEDSDLDPLFKAVIRWTDDYLLTPAHPRVDVREEVQAALGVDGEAELACAMAIFRAFGKSLIALGLEPEPGQLPVSIVLTPGAADGDLVSDDLVVTG